MDRKPGTIRAALAGTTIALCLVATLLAACASKQDFDFPVMRLTSPPAADAQSEPQQ